MKNSTRWTLYTLLRVGLFAAVLAVLMLLNFELWFAAIIATIVAFAISYLFFRKTRQALALDLQQRRANPAADTDGDAEDAPEDDTVAETASVSDADEANATAGIGLEGDHRGDAESE